MGKLTEFNKSYNSNDIWRVRNKNKFCYTFRQNHFSGIIRIHLDYIFMSNSLEEYVKTAYILNAFSTDNSTVFCTFSFDCNFQKGSSFWKINNLQVLNEDFVEEKLHSAREKPASK